MQSAVDLTSSPTGSSRLYSYLAISGLQSLAMWILLLLPVFLEERAWSSQKIGWAIGAYFVVNLVVQIFAGQIADRYGNVPTALWGTAVAGIGGALYLLSLWSTAVLFAARVFHATGAAMIFTGALMQLLRSVPLQLRGRMMGYFGLPGFVMMGVGPVIAEWLVHHSGFRGVFVSIPMIFGVVAWILSRLHRPLVPKGTRREPFSEGLRASFADMKSILAFSVSFGLCFSAWNSFLAPTVRPLGAGAVSGFGMGYGVGAVLTRTGISHLLDRGSRRYAAISTLLAYGACLALIPHARHTGHLIALGLICGMVHGIYYPGLSSIAAERFHPLHTGQAMSLYFSASALGMFFGPPCWGAIADGMGYPFMYAIAGSVMAISTLIFLVSQRRTKLASVTAGTP